MPHGLGHINISQHFHLTFSPLRVERGAYIHPTPHRSHSGSRRLSDLGRSHLYASLSSVIDWKLISHYSAQPLNSPSPSFLSPLVCNVLSCLYIQMVLWTTSLPFLQPDSSVRIGFLSLLSQTRTQSLSLTSHKPQAQKVMLSVSLTLKRCFQAISLLSYIRTNKQVKTKKQTPSSLEPQCVQLCYHHSYPCCWLLASCSLLSFPEEKKLLLWLLISLSTSSPVIIYDNCMIHLNEPVHTLIYQFFNTTHWIIFSSFLFPNPWHQHFRNPHLGQWNNPMFHSGTKLVNGNLALKELCSWRPRTTVICVNSRLKTQ